MAALAGNLPGFEEAIRALFAGDRGRFEERVAAWPSDLRDYAMRLAFGPDDSTGAGELTTPACVGRDGCGIQKKQQRRVNDIQKQGIVMDSSHEKTRKEILADFLREVWSGGRIEACDTYLAQNYAIRHDPVIRGMERP